MECLLKWGVFLGEFNREERGEGEREERKGGLSLSLFFPSPFSLRLLCALCG